MPATTAERILPSFSTSKHVSVSPSRRQLRIGVFILVFIALIVFASSHFRPIHVEKIPLPSTYLSRPEGNVSDMYTPDPLHPLSTLGPKADQVYKLGSLSPTFYRESLGSFISEAFPLSLQSQLNFQLNQYLDDPSKNLPKIPKIIWQTFDIYPETSDVRSWQSQNQGYDYRFLKDDDADEWVKRNLKGSRIEELWNKLPHFILKSDLLRYLLLYIEGGIYSDVDTVCLKPVDMWGQVPNIRGQLRGGDSPSAIIGIEADVGERQDWYKWWSRPVQIVQWTLAFGPGHPILLDVIERVFKRTLELENSYNGSFQSYPEKQLLPMVLEWTGPAAFTDAVLRFFKIEDDLQWIDLRGIRKPLRIGAITILPVTGFSPGVGNFGAGEPSDEQAMVQHNFKGSWKAEGWD